jgi:hypothetical protein
VPETPVRKAFIPPDLRNNINNGNMESSHQKRGLSTYYIIDNIGRALRSPFPYLPAPLLET